jgi:hypothetical protein
MDNNCIKVHALTNNPTAAWKEISKNQKIIKLNVKIPSKPVEPNKMGMYTYMPVILQNVVRKMKLHNLING